MIYDSDNDILDLIVLNVTSEYVKRENVSNLLNGDWHIQTIGTRAEKLYIETTCLFSVLNELKDYADTKEELTIEYLGLTKTGVIAGQPEATLLVNGAPPRYTVNFEMVITNV